MGWVGVDLRELSRDCLEFLEDLLLLLTFPLP